MEKKSKIRILLTVILSVVILAGVITLVAVYATKCNADKDDIGNVGEEPGGNGEEPGGNGEEPGGNGEEPGGNGEEPGGNGEEPNNPAEHKHEYGEWVIVTLPTEETEGEATRTCGGCEEGTEGHSESVTLPKLSAEGEVYGMTEDTATCTEGGKVTYTLEEYGISFDVTTDPKPHTLGQKVEGKAATCVEAGVKAHYECSVCHKYFEDENGETEIPDVVIAVDPDAHEWDEGVITTAANCTTAGVKTFTCQHDESHKKTEEISVDPDAHTYGELIAEIPATCMETGTQAHYECSVCHKYFKDQDGAKNEITDLTIPLASHTLGGQVPEKPATCVETGVKAHYECEVCHKNFEDENGEKEISDLTIALVSHALGEQVPEIPATCVAAGRRAYYRCSVCDRYFKDAIGAAEYSNPDEMIIPVNPDGHEWDEGVITTAANCTTAGEKTFTCQHDESHTKTEEYTDPDAHTIGELIPEKPATCSKTGTREHYECSVCNKYFEDAAGKTEIPDLTIEINPEAHEWDDGEITTAATCQAKGEKTYTCLYSKEHTKTEEIAIDPDAHTWGTDNKCTLCQTDMDYTKDGLKYTPINDGNEYQVQQQDGIKITGELVIPAYYEGKPVTTILKNGFAGNTFTSIIIPDTMITIGEQAFDECKNLTSVIIGNSVTTISKYCFWKCEALESVTIPDSVTTIGENAFDECRHLKTVIFGENSQLTKIADWLFMSCDALESLTIPDSVTEIGKNVFAACSSLTTVKFGAGSKLTTIGASAFQGSALTEISIPRHVTVIGDAFGGLESLKTVRLAGWHSDLTTIEDEAFMGCTGLREILNLPPNGIETIGARAFMNCSNLISFDFGSGTDEIGERAFWNCGFTNIDLGSVGSIGKEAFGNCINLTDVTIYFAGHIGQNVFGQCYSLERIEFNDICKGPWNIYSKEDKSDMIKGFYLSDPVTNAKNFTGNLRAYNWEVPNWN